jgi:hypothetical protein
MQKVYIDTYLGPINDDPTITKIYNTKDIPIEITNLKEYLATLCFWEKSIYTQIITYRITRARSYSQTIY